MPTTHSQEFQYFMRDYVAITDVSKYLKPGDNKHFTIDSENFKGAFIAFQLVI